MSIVCIMGKWVLRRMFARFDVLLGKQDFVKKKIFSGIIYSLFNLFFIVLGY